MKKTWKNEKSQESMPVFKISELSTDQLKLVVGDWENERKELIAKNPTPIRHPFFGLTYPGIVEKFVKEGAIRHTLDRGTDYWSVCLPEWNTWGHKEFALRELWGRRTYAQQQDALLVTSHIAQAADIGQVPETIFDIDLSTS